MIKEFKLILLFLVLISSCFAIASGDSDGDGIADFKDPYIYDFDNDGIPDDYEMENGLDKMKSNEGLDSDSDDLTDLEEYKLGTNPKNVDSDGDGLTDKEEVDRETDPNNNLSPFNLIGVTKILIPLLIIVLFILIIFYFIFNNKSLKREVEDSDEKKIKSIQAEDVEKFNTHKIEPIYESTPSKPGIDVKKETPTLSKKKDEKHLLDNLTKLFNILLGPSMEKAKQKEKEDKEKEKKKEEEKEEREKEKESDSKELIQTKITNEEEIDPKNFLMRILNRNKKHNNFHDVLAYFDKIIGKEELTFFKERKSKKEIIEWLNKKKEMKNKLIEMLNNQEIQKQSIIKNQEKLEKQPVNTDKKEESIFDRLDKISDDVYEGKLK